MTEDSVHVNGSLSHHNTRLTPHGMYTYCTRTAHHVGVHPPRRGSDRLCVLSRHAALQRSGEDEYCITNMCNRCTCVLCVCVCMVCMRKVCVCTPYYYPLTRTHIILVPPSPHTLGDGRTADDLGHDRRLVHRPRAGTGGQVPVARTRARSVLDRVYGGVLPYPRLLFSVLSLLHWRPGRHSLFERPGSERAGLPPRAGSPRQMGGRDYAGGRGTLVSREPLLPYAAGMAFPRHVPCDVCCGSASVAMLCSVG